MSLQERFENREKSIKPAVFQRRSVSNAIQPEYLSLKDLARYSGLSVRRLRDYLHDSIAPLPYYQPAGGKVLVRVTEFHDWMKGCRHERAAAVDGIVAELLKGVA